jgi:hypothetical protein
MRLSPRSVSRTNGLRCAKRKGIQFERSCEMKRRAILVVGCLLLCWSSARADLSSGLVAHYSFSGHANDGSGYGHHGTVHGATLTMDHFGNPNSAYGFDGMGDYIDIAAPLTTTLGTNYSVSAWIETDTISSTYGIIATYRHRTEPSVVFQLDRGGADVRFIVRDSSSRMAAATYFDALTPDNWYHVAGVRTGDNLRIFVDAVEGTPSSNAFGEMIPNDLKIGALDCCHLGIHHPFSGSIHDVRIYDRALSASEVHELYIIPAPGAAILGTLGLSFSGWILRRRRVL